MLRRMRLESEPSANDRPLKQRTSVLYTLAWQSRLVAAYNINKHEPLARACLSASTTMMELAGKAPSFQKRRRMQHITIKMRQWLLASGLALGFIASSMPPAQASSGTQAHPAQLPPPTDEVLLTIDGAINRANVGNEAQLDLQTIQGLPAHSVRTTTAVTDGVRKFDGVLMRDLLKLVDAQGQAVTTLALNDYSVDIPIEDFHDYDVLLATHMDGERLQPSDKGPFWIIYPRDDWRQLQDIRYDSRWVWQLHRLTVK